MSWAKKKKSASSILHHFAASAMTHVPFPCVVTHFPSHTATRLWSLNEPVDFLLAGVLMRRPSLLTAAFHSPPLTDVSHSAMQWLVLLCSCRETFALTCENTALHVTQSLLSGLQSSLVSLEPWARLQLISPQAGIMRLPPETCLQGLGQSKRPGWERQRQGPRRQTVPLNWVPGGQTTPFTGRTLERKKGAASRKWTRIS